MRFISKNPDAKAKDVASALGISPQSVYQVVHNVKKKGANGLPMTALAPNQLPKKTKTIKVVRVKQVAADMVNHPPHYKAGGIETIDFIEAKNLGYHLGNVVKYVSRADLKGAKLEDLKKAQWYLNRAVSTLEKRA